MDIYWLGHSGFRIETEGAVLLIDPWLRGNPTFDEARFDEAIEGATHLLITHGHDDHASGVREIADATGASIVGIYDYTSWLEAQGASDTIGMNKGGTVECGAASVTMTHAVHSSSTMIDGRPVYLGAEAGFMIEAEGRTIYAMGDTDVFSDMAIYQELHHPSIGLVPIGGRFTMDAERAAFACSRFFDFKTIIPCHYGTFPLLAPDAGAFTAAMEGTGARIVAPEVMEKVSF